MAQYIKTEEGYKELATVTDDKMDKTNPTGTGSFSMNRKAGTVVGANSHAEGNNTTAGGNYSHAEGSRTTASASSSHAEGYFTTASGQSSHAEGDSTTASGTDSHSEGYSTTASGTDSHAEGDSTTASGQSSHAEGISTTASGYNSHAEGNQTTVSGRYSHAEGNSTNKFSSVVTTTNPTTDDIINVWKNKKFSVAKGDCSHVEGEDNLALGDYSHAEGCQTTANGFASHAEGGGTTANGFDSHAEGGGTTASGYYSHAEGNNTTASGQSSHAEGFDTTASGNYSHVQGKYNIKDTSNKYADIIGNGTITKRSNAATVDWSGNAWFAGDVYTGSTSGTNKDDGSKKLATEEYVNNSIAAGGDNTYYLVKITASSWNLDNATFTIEQTHNEIYEAYQSGKTIIADLYAEENLGDIKQDVYQGRLSTIHVKTRGYIEEIQFIGFVKESRIAYIWAYFDGSQQMYCNGKFIHYVEKDDIVTSISSSSKDSEVPSAKCVYDELQKTDTKSLGLTSAAVGQTIKVKAVDESGKPTEWEAADMSEGVALDTTLTQSGKAADAKTVGDRFHSLSDEIVATSESKVAAHNTGTDTHGDIRLLIQGLTDRLNALADSDDTTLDQLSEVVAYIKSNRSLIEAITTSKVNVSDIVDNLTTNVSNKPLSAAQGVALKALIDAISIPDKLPNPNALTFTGAVECSYDGSEPLTVEIPGGGEKWETILDLTLKEDVNKVVLMSGNVGYKKIMVYMESVPPTDQTVTSNQAISVYSGETTIFEATAKLNGAYLYNGNRLNGVSIELTPYAANAFTSGSSGWYDSGTPNEVKMGYSSKNSLSKPIKELTAQVWNNALFGVGSWFKVYGVRA